MRDTTVEEMPYPETKTEYVLDKLVAVIVLGLGVCATYKIGSYIHDRGYSKGRNSLTSSDAGRMLVSERWG
ncbi:MAG: hypothetical protein DRQ88_06000 [Epsilonproteobacteria bacterium]|nr:MAG: hypothetical protein DRQ88_06000 [Campylobacterota bacterium]